ARDVLVSPEQLPDVLAKLRGDVGTTAAAPSAPATAPAGDDRYGVDPVAESTSGYPEVEASSDEDAWNLTDRDGSGKHRKPCGEGSCARGRRRQATATSRM